MKRADSNRLLVDVQKYLSMKIIQNLRQELDTKMNSKNTRFQIKK